MHAGRVNRVRSLLQLQVHFVVDYSSSTYSSHISGTTASLPEASCESAVPFSPPFLTAFGAETYARKRRGCYNTSDTRGSQISPRSARFLKVLHALLGCLESSHPRFRRILEVDCGSPLMAVAAQRLAYHTWADYRTFFRLCDNLLTI